MPAGSCTAEMTAIRERVPQKMAERDDDIVDLRRA
jgi:hypothetical protein